jgi:hypothetical protein
MKITQDVKFSVICSILASSVVTFISWAGVNLASSSQSWQWIAYLGAILSLPGSYLAVFFAAIFSPQGFHGGDDFSWVVAPFDLLFYFALSFLLVRSMRRDRSPA